MASELEVGSVKAETYRSGRSDGDVYIQAATASDFVAIGTQVSSNLLKVDGSGDVTVGVGGTGTNHTKVIVDGTSAADRGPRIEFKRNSVIKSLIGSESGIAGGSSDDLLIFSESGGVKIGVGGYATRGLTVASTGLATFTGEIHSNSTAPKISMTDNNSFADANDKFIIRGGGGGNEGAGYLQWYDDSASATHDIARFDGETQLAQFYGGIKTEKGIYGGQISIADDAVGTITPPRQGVMMAISYGNNSAYPAHQNMAGLIWCDTGSSLTCAKLTSEGSSLSVGTSDLTVAAGVDGDINIAAISGTIQIKNRVGSTIEIWYNFIA